MKKIIQIQLMLLLFVACNLHAQAQASLQLSNVSGAPQSTIAVPVTAAFVSDMQGFQFTIDYDNTKLSYVNCTDWSGAANAPGVQITDIPAQGKVTFVYNDVSVNISSGLFFNLNFQILQGATGTAALAWSDVPTLRELSNSVPEVIAATYGAGTVTINTTVGIEGAAALEFTVSPNPTDGVFTVTTNSQGTYFVEVYNLTGQLLLTKQAAGNSALLDIQAYASGIYLITVSTAESVKRIKVIKK